MGAFASLAPPGYATTHTHTITIYAYTYLPQLATAAGNDLEEADKEAEKEDAQMSDDDQYSGAPPTLVSMATLGMLIVGMMASYV